MKYTLCSFSFILVFFASMTTVSSQGQVSVIAMTGADIQGAPGLKYDSFSDPRLNNHGEVAFWASLDHDSTGVNDTNDSGFWATAGQSPQLVARENDVAPGTGGALFGRITDLRFSFNDRGLAFTAGLANLPDVIDGDNNGGIWAGSNSSLNLISQRGDTLPGAPSESMISGYPELTTNSVGTVAFRAYLGGPFSTINVGIWTSQDGIISKAVRVGDTAPNSQGAIFGSAISPAVLGSGNHVAFTADLVPGIGDIDDSNDLGMWITDNEMLRLVAQKGNLAPGTDSAVLDRFATPAINASGVALYRACLKRDGQVNGLNDSGIWLNSSQSHSLLARSGNIAAGLTNELWGSFGETLLNDQGTVAFKGTLQHDGAFVDESNDQGIWQFEAGTTRLVARGGDVAPGTSGALFDDFSPYTQTLAQSQCGDLLFEATLQHSSDILDDTNDDGIWLFDNESDAITLIVREGMLFDTSLSQDGSDLRTISYIDYTLGFNIHSQVAFGLDFADGSAGIFIVSVPTTSTASAMLLLGLITCRRRRASHRCSIRPSA